MPYEIEFWQGNEFRLNKRDLYKKMIVDGFNPVLVFEDKITVVDMWKEMGLRCLRVTGA